MTRWIAVGLLSTWPAFAGRAVAWAEAETETETETKTKTETKTCPPRFSISLGAGVGMPLGASADRFDPGVHAAVDLRWFPDASWALWLQSTLALLPLVDGLPVEPGAGSSVSAFTAVIGAELRVPIAADLWASFALGVGVGGFGLAAADEAMGWAIDATAGARYQLDPNLAVRLDFAPVLVIPIDPERTAGGHLAFVLRGEASF